MLGFKRLRWVAIFILIFIATLKNSVADEYNFQQSKQELIFSADDLDKLIKTTINNNLPLSSDLHYLNYYDYYFLSDKLNHHTSIVDLLIITEASSYQEEPEIEDKGQLIVNVKLNYEDIEPIFNIFKDDDGDILISLKDLLSLDINRDYLSYGATKSIDDVDYVFLKSLPRARYALDSQTQILALNFPPGAMQEQHFDANNNSKVSDFSKPANGAYLNYDITLTNSKKFKTLTGIQELNLFTEKGTGTTSALVRKRFAPKQTKTFIRRLESYWVIENENNLTRWNYGDDITQAASWSGSTRFGGVQYSSNFAIRPGIITHPLIDFNGTVESPSNISVYSGLKEIYNGQAKTGHFNISNLPVTTGNGNLIVKLKDITGKIQTVIIPYYNTAELLSPGIINFSYGIGMQRQKFGIANNDYKHFVTSFDHMKGINDSWTVGGHVESMDKILSYGLTSINKLGLYGIVETSIAATHHNGLNSQRGKIDYSFQKNNFSFFTGLTIDFGEFPDTFAFKDYYSKKKTIGKSFQTSIGYGTDKLGSAFISFTTSRVVGKESAGQISILSGSYSKEINKDNIIALNCGTSLFKKKKDRDIFASLSYSLNLGNKSISVGLSKRSADKATSKDISISAPSEQTLGWGYIADIHQHGKHNSYDITVNKNSKTMNTAFYFFDVDHEKVQQVSFMGSVTEIDKSIYFSRPIDNSLVLIKTSNFKNIPVYVNNHLIGETNASGQILAPDLIPYHTTEIRMDALKVPLEAKFSYLTLYATPRWKSGTILNFDISKQRSLQMKMLDNSNVPLDVTRSLKIDGIAEEVLVGYNGIVYIEDIKNLEEIVGSSCDETNRCCSFNIPLNMYENEEIIDLGEEICK